jgi:hypothetical protein
MAIYPFTGGRAISKRSPVRQYCVPPCGIEIESVRIQPGIVEHTLLEVRGRDLSPQGASP